MRSALSAALRRWVDSAPGSFEQEEGAARRIDWLRVLPFLGIHAGCLLALWTGVSATAAVCALALYLARMFAITAFYHRYCAHRAYRMSRLMQFLFALLAGSAAQRGPLWWASHHRHHHAHSDRAGDAHSALRDGLLWSHLGWFLARENFAPRAHLVRDLARYPELRFLERFDVLAPVALIALLYAAGAFLAAAAPHLGTSGPQLVVWGFFISTVALYHATFTVNSLAHRCGARRYATPDDSRNNLWIALLTLGEGWHNNHHHYAGAARQGFYWWEIDATWLGLRLLAAFGLVSALRELPSGVREAGRIGAGA